GEWWYWTPDSQWMFHRNGQWNTYNPDTFTRVETYGTSPRYETGYRGTTNTYYNDGYYDGGYYSRPYNDVYRGTRVYGNRFYRGGTGYGAGYGTGYGGWGRGYGYSGYGPGY